MFFFFFNSYEIEKSNMVELAKSCMEKNQKTVLKIDNHIVLECPGKHKLGDYELFYDGFVPTHGNMCDKIYNTVVHGEMDYCEMKDLLEGVYKEGLDYCVQQEKYKELKTLLFWITLQEEINHAPEDGKLGRKLPFLRYAEALMAAKEGSREMLKDAKKRTRDKNPSELELWNDEDAPDYYKDMAA